ncbi:hypothetical protein EVAR_256_1 [Eumeta japonica]|uniref:Tc1-like transposase DDE domain-containing protein n=1 Tax=Eumeta variegata TaxID=151549 RepID=A0A4C1S962_EUMVA|nr:hypothetical protein EVAR_256_1 [Eumeta japonica]
MPRTLKSGERELVSKVRSFCEREKQNKEPLIPLEKSPSSCRYHDSAGKCWQSETEKGVFTSDSKGPRWIIVHAGSDKGFVPNAQLIFKSQSKSGDYHDDMNRDNFMKWLQQKLTPNLPPQSIVVMDNAPYHSVVVNKTPTMSTTKAEMQNWIVSKGLSYLPTMVKAQLFEIIQEHKERPVYEADSLLEQYGHKVVRLPPYHCDLNAIELIWSLLKRRIAEKNVGQEAKNIIKITEEAFSSITAEEWKKECEHVKNIEENYFIIEVGGDETDTSDSENRDTDSSNISDVSPLDDHDYFKK